MSPKSQPQSDKEPITQEIDPDELRELIQAAAENRLKALTPAQIHARQYLRDRVAKWIESRRRPDCQ